MLTDSELTLITAAVDGELSASDVRRYDRLIAANPQAAAVAAQLRGNADRLRRLPVRVAPALLLPTVLGRLPRVEVRSRRPARRPLWVPYAVAASLLFAVSAGSFWFFSATRGGTETAQSRPSLPVATNTPSVFPQAVPAVPERPPLAVAGPDELPLPREVVAAGPQPRDTAPMPRPHGGDFVGAGISEPSKPLQAVKLELPFVGSVSDFAEKEMRQQFAADYAGDPAVRIDLFAHNLWGGIDTVTAAAKAAGVVVTVDAFTKDRIGKQVSAAYAIYVEGLTPAELASLLASVAARVASAPRPAISMVHVFRAGPADHRDLKDLFGRDFTLTRSSREEPRSPSRPISAGTLGKIKEAVTGNPAKAGVLLTFLPVVGRVQPTASKEIKAFLAGRGEPKAGTLSAVLVVRPSAN
jgi:hypothetical protein